MISAKRSPSPAEIQENWILSGSIPIYSNNGLIVA